MTTIAEPNWESVAERRAYETREALLARQNNSPIPYWRLEDKLCRCFLEAMSDPVEFAGLRALFPFVREASVLGLPQAKKHLGDWMYFAFVAGHELGRHFPDLLPDVLPDYELRQGRKRLGLLRGLTGETAGSWRGLAHALDEVVKRQWAEVDDEKLPTVQCEVAIKSMRVGFLAATAAQTDPSLFEYVDGLASRSKGSIRADFADPVWRTLLGAPVEQMKAPLIERLEHPLLRVARQIYPENQPTERDTVLGYLREHLRTLDVASENECRATETELLDWIACGMEYGRRLLVKQPETVNRILRENGEKRLNDSLGVVREVVKAAGGDEPALLLPQLKRWLEKVHGLAEPQFYGQTLARVAFFADFAVWIPWATSASAPPAPEAAELTANASTQGTDQLERNA